MKKEINYQKIISNIIMFSFLILQTIIFCYIVNTDIGIKLPEFVISNQIFLGILFAPFMFIVFIPIAIILLILFMFSVSIILFIIMCGLYLIGLIYLKMVSLFKYFKQKYIR